jgi:hypothetical protein
MEIFYDPKFLIFWTAMGSLCTAISAVGLIITIVASSRATRDAMKSFKKNLETSHYTELDSMYFELLKLALEKPHLADPNAKRDETQKQEYNIYAYMVWNFLETIHDQCQGDKCLKETWYPVIDAENRLHRQWFEDKENKHKFKDRFKGFIHDNRFKSWIAGDA